MEPGYRPEYSNEFREAVRWVIDVAEGGDRLVVDTGGATLFGISSRAYPGEEILTLSRSRAVELYHRDFWERMRCDEMPWPLSFVAFDAAVNHGTGTAARMLQEALRVEVDGVVGPDTLAACQDHPREKAGSFLARRHARYNVLADRSAEHADYRTGWHRRLVMLSEAVGFIEAGKLGV